MNSWALARSAASSTSASLACCRPYRMLSRTEPSNRKTSCWTMARSERYDFNRRSRRSVPLSRMRPRVGSWKRATRSVTVVLPAPLRPTSATTVPPGTVTLKSRTTGTPSRYSNSTPSKVMSWTTAGASTAFGRSGLSRSMPRISKTRSIAASERCISENELTMFQTGLSSRKVYHWNAMMSPTEARPVTARYPPYQTITTLTPATRSPPGRPQDHLPAVGEQFLAEHRVPAEQVAEELPPLPPERPDDADPGERLARPAVDRLGILADRAVDR